MELAGDARVVVDDHVLAGRALRGSVLRRVLAVLALERRPVSRDELGDAVWGEDLPRTWETALRGAVHQLRKAVADHAPGHAEVVRTAFGCYQLDPAAAVDVELAAADLDAAEGALAAGEPALALARAEAALAVLREPLLVGIDTEWLAEARRRLAALHVRALLATSAAATACGDLRRAVEAAAAAVEADPWAEAAHRRLMAAHAAAGDRGAALVAYRRCREVLADDLGVDPSEETEAVRRAALGAARPMVPLAMPASLDRSLPLAGRDDVVAGLAAALPAAVAIVGPAGVGKSRLAAELAAVAHERGAAVVHGRFDHDDLGAFGAFTEVLGQLGVGWPPPVGTAGAGPDRTELFALATDALAAAAAGTGLVVVLDDVHWADRASVALLGHLVAAAVADVHLVLTARDDWMPPPVAELLEAVRRVDLAALDRRGTADLVAAWSGQPLGEPDLVRIHGITAGNPFFVTALLQDLADRHAVDLSTGIATGHRFDEVPATLGGVIADAVDRCGTTGRRLALAAAVLGDEFRPDALAAVAGLAPGATAATLERLVHARVLGHAGQDTTRFRFVHALVRQAVLDAAEPADVRDVHRRAAAVADEPLRHLLAARDESTLDDVVAGAVAAAEDLVDRGAPDEAIELLAGVLSWLDESGEHGTRRRAAVLVALAVAEVSVDQLAAGRRHLREAAEVALALGDASVLGTGVVLLRPATPDEQDPGTVDLIARALATTEPGTRAHGMVSCWLAAEVGTVEPERATAAAAVALADARRLADPVLHRVAALTWHLMGRALLTPAERRAAMEEVLDLRPPAGKRSADVTARAFLAGDCLEVGDRDVAAAAVASLLEDTAAYGRTHLRWLALRNAVMLHVLDGDFDEADRLSTLSAEVAAALPIPEAAMFPVLQTIITRYHQGRLGELHPLVAAFDDTAPAPVLTIVRAWMEAELGLPSAPVHVARAVDAALVMPRAAGWIGLTAATVEAAAAVGDARVGELAARLAPLSGRHAVIVTIAYLGAVDRYLGLAAGAAGDAAGARALLERSLEQHRAVGSKPYIDRTERELRAFA